MKNNEASSLYTVQAVSKTIEMLEILSDQAAPADLPLLASKVAMTRNKTFRLLTTLCEKGLVERDTKSGTYQLSFNSVSLAHKMLRQSPVINLAHPIMEELAKKHHEAVYMTVARGDEILFLDMVDCEQQIKATPLVGRRFPSFSTAAGKVIKALETRELADWLLNKKPGKKSGGVDSQQLASELLEIRSNGGVSIDCGGLGEGISSVAVAVRDYGGAVIGAITLLGPSFRMVKERIENEIVPSLIEGAALISEKFGYTTTEKLVFN
ncbi:IclR family transcriptional regulator [Geobacter chapellei]|uniref:IclR family transcriptional regulator n=2 Tax=Pelotalea chapellei TaxID=44671 RepID=A0ABS5U3T7_9BACT|nr:IclR family transcriptional regulator [Pelotalea chapellei]MBT1070331.1 IclR family transcriptional regulator [Pelotalea chapellei]